MAGDLGAELKQYTINILNSLGSEVDKQFEKWARPEIGFLAQLCRAQQAAVKEQAEVLNELAEDQRRSYERSLFVLEILTIPATSWLLATLELKVGKKIFYEYEGAMVQVHDIPWVALPKTRVWNEYNSKIFGDMGKEIADSLSKLAGEKFLANDHEDVNPHSVAYSPNAGVFALNLHAEVYKQQRQIKDTILKITQDIARSMTFGRALVQRLRSENPHFESWTKDVQRYARHEPRNMGRAVDLLWERSSVSGLGKSKKGARAPNLATVDCTTAFPRGKVGVPTHRRGDGCIGRRTGGNRRSSISNKD